MLRIQVNLPCTFFKFYFLLNVFFLKLNEMWVVVVVVFASKNFNLFYIFIDQLGQSLGPWLNQPCKVYKWTRLLFSKVRRFYCIENLQELTINLFLTLAQLFQGSQLWQVFWLLAECGCKADAQRHLQCDSCYQHVWFPCVTLETKVLLQWETLYYPFPGWCLGTSLRGL